MSRPLLGSVFGSLLGPSTMSSNPLGKVQEIMSNLEKCDVKHSGMCCYFPDFCDPIATCISATSPSNVFEIAQTIPKCVCPEGFDGDGRSKGSGCKNIDECQRGIHRCQHECVDLIPGYTCKCMPGFRLNPDGRTCIDVDECAERLHNCSQMCVNEHGGFSCACRTGYKVDRSDPTQCVDIDECEEARITGFSVCQFDELCVNLKGTYQCNCPPGLKPSNEDTRRCEDIDECSMLDNPCPNGLVEIDGIIRSTQMCENVFGGYVCSCLPGTRSKITTEAISVLSQPLSTRNELLLSPSEITQRYEMALNVAANQVCEDIDECQETPDICSTDETFSTKCINEFRGYRCDCGNEGYEFDQQTKSCVDIDECEAKACGTDPHINCRNLVPGFDCYCDSGYRRIHKSTDSWACIDIDECAEAVMPLCPSGSTCTNYDGGYECVCQPGYRWHPGAEQRCVDINECELDYCASPCLNLPGNYTCACPFGHATLGYDNKKTRLEWLRASDEVQGESPERALAAFQVAASNQVKCQSLNVCHLTDNKVCGIGFRCTDVGKGAVSCVCPTNEHLMVLNTDPKMLLALSEQIGTHLQSFPPHLLLDFNPLTLLKAFATLPKRSPPWMLLNVDWDSSQRFVLPDSDDAVAKAVKLAASAEEPFRALAELYSDLLYDAAIKTCTSQDPCQSQPPPCKGIRPCCKALGHDQTECLPLRYRITSRVPTCPSGSVLLS